VCFIEGLWDKHRMPLNTLLADRDVTAGRLAEMVLSNFHENMKTEATQCIAL
jgi:hypothetical protein